MKRNNFVNHSFKGVKVDMKAQRNVHQQLLRGKMMIDIIENNLLFVQNNPRGPRSAEVMRTPHSRMVRRPDGQYTLTFRFSANEFCIAEQLLLEMQSIATNPLLNLNRRAA